MTSNRRDPVAWLFGALLAGCGSTHPPDDTVDGRKAALDVAPLSAALSAVNAAARPVVRCPVAMPAEGNACDLVSAPFQCEYGGDRFGRDTTLATCVPEDELGSSFTW